MKKTKIKAGSIFWLVLSIFLLRYSISHNNLLWIMMTAFTLFLVISDFI